MSYLIRSITAAHDGAVTPAACLDLVHEAHSFLVACASRAIAEAQQHGATVAWGTTLKRTRVQIPVANRPTIVTPRDPYHNLVEVINQCAAIERLLDALRWAATAESALDDWQVLACHPTTSSAQEDGKRADIDNDLVLQGPNDTLARFEVSDIASDQDTNRKEEKDLRSLGALTRDSGTVRYQSDWGNQRLFLVVSKEFSGRLLRPKHGIASLGPRPFSYVPVSKTAGTTILELQRRAE
jgi:hypothetical protein